LQVRGVHFSTKNLVESGSSGQDDRLTLDLDSSVSQPQQICSDTDGTGRDQGDGEDVIVGSRSGTGDETRTLQALDSETVLETDDCGDLVSPLAIDLNLVRDDATSYGKKEGRD
jgi:hypothetical protein